MEKMADAAVDYSRHFTYGDYRKWPDEERWELIDGQAFSMWAGSLASFATS